MAKMAAMKNVLSPTSEVRMDTNDLVSAALNSTPILGHAHACCYAYTSSLSVASLSLQTASACTSKWSSSPETKPMAVVQELVPQISQLKLPALSRSSAFWCHLARWQLVG
jgi:hypothetical protein